MNTELEKLENMRDLFSIASIVLVIFAFIMTISLVFIKIRINEIYKEKIENSKLV